ncbi:hypothetical protein TI03_00140 [Achromatium sp. WMS1]|nr:hypothetical protein TI03_00140 [Achromatium sp. WMS1]
MIYNIVFIFLLSLSYIGAFAEPVTEVEQITAMQKALDTDTTLSNADKKKANDFYEQALSGLKEKQRLQTQMAALDAQIENAPKRIAEIRAAMIELKNHNVAVDTYQGLSLSQIEARITNDTLILNQQKDFLRQLEDNLATLLVGAKGLTEDIAEKTRVLEKLNQDLASFPVDEPLVLQQARLIAIKMRRQVRIIEIELMKKRLGNSVLTDLAQNERDLLVAQIAQLESQLTTFKQQEQLLQETKAATARKQAEAQVKQVHKAQLSSESQAIASSNADFNQELEKLVIQEQKVSNQLQLVTQELDELQANFDRTRQRVEVVGTSPAIGRMLRQRRAELPSLQDYRRESWERTEQISKATERQLEIDELLSKIPAIQQTLENTSSLPADTKINLSLITTHRNSLHELQKFYSRYIAKLTSLDVAERQLLLVAKTYTKYIDDQLLWIPSINLLSVYTHADSAFNTLEIIDNWFLIWQNLSAALRHWPLHLSLLIVLLMIALIYRRKIPAQLQIIDLTIRKIRNDKFQLSLQALLLTILISIPIPLAIIILSYLLYLSPTSGIFTLAIANGLLRMGLLIGSLGMVQTLCKNEGLGDRHLRWPEPIRMALLNILRWLIPLGAILSFLVAATANYELPLLIQSIGVIAFVILMLIIAWSAYYVFKDVIVLELVNKHTDNWANSLYFIWFPSVVGVPIILATASIIGFHYTAICLEQQLQITIWFFLGLLLLRDLILRWLFMAERRLRYEDALRRREEQRMQRAKEETLSEKESSPIVIDIPEVDYTSLSEQSRRLIYAGFLFAVIMGSWAIWNDLLPTLTFLNSSALPFETTHIVDGIAKRIPITWSDLIIGLFSFLVTILAAKNLPGILEILLLQHLPMDAGARYAATTLSQYLIVAAGTAVTFGNLGVEWVSIQWLIAALGVGLGFGLQEIVANFISGIILLFERPIRIGDTITIDNITGIVARIHIRATTITNYDMQDLIVPNKEFITGRLINWTLSNTINRITIHVGIAYGSDVRKTLELLTVVASENEYVLKEPKPIIIFKRFGESTLDLMMHCYLGSVDNRLFAINSLNMAINDKFATAGISIAFPQRDLHLINTVPLKVQLQT